MNNYTYNVECINTQLKYTFLTKNIMTYPTKYTQLFRLCKLYRSSPPLIVTYLFLDRGDN